MNKKPNIFNISEIIKEIVSNEGFEFWGVEWVTPMGRPTLRVFIDHEKGITVGECAKVSRLIGPTLDAEDIISGKFHLEVSSPGLERPLFTFNHFYKYQGSKIRVKLKTAVENSRKLTGILAVTNEEKQLLSIETTEKIVEIEFVNISKANLIFEH